jgi:dTDP-4-dehydrorhamnose reductase
VKVAIFGVGFLGSKLMEYFSKSFEVLGTDINPPSNSSVVELDATNEKEVEKFLILNKPDIVIDTIALASYFVCENNIELCKRLNYDTANNIAVSCKKIRAKMFFISSSYVFDGEKGSYTETDLPNSINEYARSKIRAEYKVLESNNSVVIRLEPMYGYDQERKQIKVGTNTFESDLKVGYPEIVRKPVFINDVPKVIYNLINNNQKGIYNIAGQDKVNWLDFLKSLASLTNVEEKVKVVDNSNWILKPPHDSTLDTSKIASLGIKMTSFESALKELKNILSF